LHCSFVRRDCDFVNTICVYANTIAVASQRWATIDSKTFDKAFDLRSTERCTMTLHNMKQYNTLYCGYALAWILPVAS
jgi:hypothetical protein